MSQCPTVTILIGLPGSGKTTYLDRELPTHLRDCCFDNFHECSLDNTGTFIRSRSYEKLKVLLRDGMNCLISDIEYCRTERLLDAEENLRALAQELGIGIRIVRRHFENDPNACRHNIVHRYSQDSRRDYIQELKKVDELSRVYECPSEGAVPVKTCCHIHPSPSFRPLAQSE
jgi:hypothetical protein